MYNLLPPGSMFAGRYRVGRCIASGGMGAVHEVEHVETGRPGALKVMLPHVLSGDGARAQFKAEARVAASLRSEHVVDVLDAGVDEATDMPYLVMELLVGEDLGARLRRLGPLPADEVIVILAQVARALDRVHRAGIVHRDLKPENLFLTEREDGTLLVKVLDFGIAKILSDGATSAITVEARGTPIYMSPEQFTHEMKISPATDIYALGMVAFTLLTGSPYWGPELAKGMNVFLIARLAEAGPQEPASVRARERGVELSPEFDAWFTRVTCANPKGRFADALEAVDALAGALAVELPPRTERPSLAGADSRPSRIPRSSPAGSLITPGAGGATPRSAGDPRSTPARGSATPARGSATPARAASTPPRITPTDGLRAPAREGRAALAGEGLSSDPYTPPLEGAGGTPVSGLAAAPPDRVSSPYTAPQVVVRRTLPRADRVASPPPASGNPDDGPPRAAGLTPPAGRAVAGPDNHAPSSRGVAPPERRASGAPGHRDPGDALGLDADGLLSSTRDSDASRDAQAEDGQARRGVAGEGRVGRPLQSSLRRAARWAAPTATLLGLAVAGSLLLRPPPAGPDRDSTGALADPPPSPPPPRSAQGTASGPQILVAPSPTGSLEPPAPPAVSASGAALPGPSATAAASASASARRSSPSGPAITAPPASPPSSPSKKPRYTQD